MEGLITVVAIAWLALSVWLVVISIRFLRSGRKAFDRYMIMTEQQIADRRDADALMKQEDIGRGRGPAPYGRNL